MNKSPSVPKQVWTRKRFSIFLCVLSLLTVGCLAEKESLHEMDHERPAHWPKNMEDAAQKLEQRLGQIEIRDSLETTCEEMSDLIVWAPEVAADTDLPEPEWVPIYKLSETLKNHLRAKDISINDCRDDIERLVALLRESQSKLPTTNSTKEDR